MENKCESVWLVIVVLGFSQSYLNAPSSVFVAVWRHKLWLLSVLHPYMYIVANYMHKMGCFLFLCVKMCVITINMNLNQNTCLSEHPSRAHSS